MGDDDYMGMKERLIEEYNSDPTDRFEDLDKGQVARYQDWRLMEAEEKLEKEREYMQLKEQKKHLRKSYGYSEKY